jgi:hypothetical protein
MILDLGFEGRGPASSTEFCVIVLVGRTSHRPSVNIHTHEHSLTCPGPEMKKSRMRYGKESGGTSGSRVLISAGISRLAIF